MRQKNRKRPNQAAHAAQKHRTRHVTTVTVTDPDTAAPVELEVRKDLVTGAMVGLDGSYLEQEVGPIFDPYNAGEQLLIGDNEPSSL